MASQKAVAEAVQLLVEFAHEGGSANLRITQDGSEDVLWMIQLGSPNGAHAITDSAPDFTDLVASAMPKIREQMR